MAGVADAAARCPIDGQPRVRGGVLDEVNSACGVEALDGVAEPELGSETQPQVAAICPFRSCTEGHPGIRGAAADDSCRVIELHPGIDCEARGDVIRISLARRI